jgi:vitamin B12 transporter
LVHYLETFVRYSLLNLALLPLIGITAAQAEPNDGPDTVVVTATRIPTPEAQVASSITVVTAEDIDARQLRTLPDLLQQVPGLNVVQTGGPGGQTSVFMRGTKSNHTKVLVDGIDLSDPGNPTGAFDFGQYLTQDIEKVEILRGPQSGLYGSDAIGGVINIITKSGTGDPKGTASLEAGSFDTFNQTAGLSGALQQFHYAATLDHFHAGSTPVTPLYALAPGEQRINDYDDNLSASTKLSYDIAPNFDLGLVARYSDTHLRITGDNFDSFPLVFPNTAQSENDARQLYTRLTGHLASFNGAFEQTLGIAYSNLKLTDLSPEDARSDTSSERVKFDWQGIVTFNQAEKMLFGAEHQRDEIRTPISASTIINSGYAELESNLAENFYDTVSVRYDGNDRFGGKVTYRVAPTYLIAQTGTKLKFTVGSGFKAPTLDQLFENFPDFGFFANPNLRPESSVGWDLGFEQSLTAASLRFGVTYFHNSIKNLITDTADFSTYTNIGRAVTEGVESFMAYEPTARLQVRLDYTYTQATDESSHTELLRIPKHKADINVGWRATDKLLLNATVLATSSWKDGNRDFTNFEPLDAGSYTVVNVAASFDLNSHFSLIGRIDNLFNRHYENPLGFQRPTVGAYAGVKARF